MRMASAKSSLVMPDCAGSRWINVVSMRRSPRWALATPGSQTEAKIGASGKIFSQLCKDLLGPCPICQPLI